jgi:putative pyruvate formate lyase activating enzyme
MDGLGEALPRYLAILRGEAEPRFKELRKFKVDFEPAMEKEELFRIHGEALVAYKKGRQSKAKGSKNLLELKIAIANKMLEKCTLCERRCKAARTENKRGHCGVLDARISSEFLHYGEEPELVPSYTIFFSGCTFNCVYCQNYDISQNPGGGEHFATEILAELILRRAPTARNVNWVGGDPTSNLSYILETLRHVDSKLAQVWNSNMYLTTYSMELLDGVIDIYLTDFKYGNDACARCLSKVENYWEIVTRNHLLARAQAELIVRHLVLPNHVECCSKPVLKWIASNLKDVRVNVMSQYRPMYLAKEYPDISRTIKPSEFLEAREYALSLGLNLVE